PSLGHALAGQLDCAVLAMRYPVGDGFATELMLALYEKLLDKQQRLPAALHLALQVALKGPIASSVLAGLTPVLLGARAGALQLAPPQRTGPITLPTTGLSIGFPPQPQRFVGRLQPMLHASQALAPHSARRAVLFHGMPGAGKSACALELAYRHEQGRFSGHVWYQAPEAGSDIASALYNLMHEIQRQLNAPELGLTAALDDPQRFGHYTLPRLRALLEQNAFLLVLDNLETLLTDSDQWRIPLWGEVLHTLLAHQGLSRVVLTSRRVPAALARDERVQIEPIHALSFAESVLLARELPRLRTLFAAEADHALLRQTLRVVQGHPKLMELADGLAADRVALQQRVQAAEAQSAASGELLDAFFAKGGTREGQSRQQPEQFVQALQGWTGDVLARLTPTAQRLFGFLCRLEAEDREHAVVLANWDDTLARLGDADAAAVAARAEPGQGLEPALQALEEAGLVEVVRSGPDAAQPGHARYDIHPGVAEAALAGADAELLQATDIELGRFFNTLVLRGLKTESEGGGAVVEEAARRGVPYLMRTQRWGEAATLLERLLQRDKSPDTIAFALPLLERIAQATAGSERELLDQGLLAKTLAKAGRQDEAERRMRDLIDRARALGQYRVASAAGSDLMILLRNAGRSGEALQVADAKAEDTRNAGFGPWTQLADESRRLQMLVALGRYDEVREAFERLRPQMAALPEVSEVDEAVDPWNVRETLLDTGRTAALHSKRYEDALMLSEEIMQSTRVRGAGALELAATHFNDYGPLLELGRLDDARTLLLHCRRVFEAERDPEGLGKVFSALAELEDKTGAPDKAAGFERWALGYKYQVGDPDGCSISHHNLANYLERSTSESPQALAHRLAATVLCVQICSGHLPVTLRALASRNLSPRPLAFADVVRQVEAVPGVRLAALFERLPRTFADGDAALATIWQMALEEREQRAGKTQVLAAMPPAIQAAFELEGEAFAQALRAALQALPADEAVHTLQRLREGGLIGTGGDTEGERTARLLEQFEPLLLDIAAVARGDGQARTALEAVLTDLEGKGFKLVEPVQRIWAGERNEAELVAELDAVDARLVARVLEILSRQTGE
ncbi:NB-ARC domain-containing protein, partial [Variovorax sp. JS1663]|uniref:NB-ARC domain-containing protein n=1 Tax=Variovorax sp. JS1663 TaxID=1851577 RepID=UPI000B341801